MSAYPGQIAPDPNTTRLSENTSSEVREPSEVVEPRKVHDVAQQGSTQPGDGSTVHEDGHLHHNDTATGARTQEKVPFKEQVIGVAQKTRGTLLGKPDLKDHGEQILRGETTHEADRKL
ncbi:hypothetical protein D9619_007116 [Psilocybe cf. subviscida]|uniref:Uncharacterized protein n=1 Tax=Psilocybe cf. subviscida TaxID=2480587 RepID=A0A8H5EWX5_9AGAR|nr:hypothetical protein D9619_007116 [Psilocybe cf. subviscida]